MLPYMRDGVMHFHQFVKFLLKNDLFEFIEEIEVHGRGRALDVAAGDGRVTKALLLEKPRYAYEYQVPGNFLMET